MHESRLILDRLAVVKIEATLWSGRKQLRPEDLILGNGSRLPPPDLASLGSKRICDPRDIQVFSRLKKESERACQKVGSRFLGGYAVPEEALVPLAASLEKIRGEFDAARLAFLSRYDEAIHEWALHHPDFGDAIRRAVDPVGRVGRQLTFDYVIFRLRAPEAGEISLNRKIMALPATLLEEIAVEARVYRVASLTGKNEVTRRALAPLRRIRDKLSGLSFMDASITSKIEAIDEVLDRLPRRGEIRGGLLRDIEAVVLSLESEAQPILELSDTVLRQEEPAPDADAFWLDPDPGIARVTPLPDTTSPGMSYWF